MAIEWTSDLWVGVPEIDEQHKSMFRMLDQLVDAMREGKGRDELGRVVAFLEDYCLNHFLLEKRWMEETRYAGIEAHRVEHETFVRDTAALRQQLESEGSSTALVIETSTRLSEWLRSHIARTDMAMGLHIRAVRKDVPSRPLS